MTTIPKKYQQCEHDNKSLKKGIQMVWEESDNYCTESVRNPSLYCISPINTQQ